MDLQALKNELIRDERAVKHAYQDSEGYWTIGVGRLIDKRKGGGLSDEEIAYLLDNDIKSKIEELDRRLPWWRNLDPVRQRVIVNMAFNLGVSGLLGFKKMVVRLALGDYEDAADEMVDSKWYGQVGDRAKRLVKMMRTGRV